jgi:hypothetical protein
MGAQWNVGNFPPVESEPMPLNLNPPLPNAQSHAAATVLQWSFAFGGGIGGGVVNNEKLSSADGDV